MNDAPQRMRRLEPAAIAGVMSREVANFRTFWKATTFSSLLEPTIYLLAFGLGLDRILAAGDGGLAATTAGDRGCAGGSSVISDQ